MTNLDKFNYPEKDSITIKDSNATFSDNLDSNKTLENKDFITYSKEVKKDILKLNTDISLKELWKEVLINNLDNFKDIDYWLNNIETYRKLWKPYLMNNWNVLFLSKDNLIVYWESTYENKEKLYKMNLENFLKFSNYPISDKIFLYRNSEIIELEKSDINYKNKNWENIKIFFWDIVSNSRESLGNQILDIDILESKIWYVSINNIKENNNWDLLINLDTRFSWKKWVKIIIKKDFKEIKLLDWDKNLEVWNFFEKDINFHNKFRGTFKFFEWNNMFDEPLNEWIREDWTKEQLDGMLRYHAVAELKKWEKVYSFNWLDYELYKDWKLSLPQVCLDYPLDFYEKFNNSYYDNKWIFIWDINFQEILWWNFFDRRRVMYFIDSVKNNKNNINDYFTIKTVSYKDAIAYSDWIKSEEIIKEKISKLVDIWDLIMISWKLWSDEKYHQHMVLVSNIEANWNIIVQENAAYPAEETLLRVLSRWPLRRIMYIIEPTWKLTGK